MKMKQTKFLEIIIIAIKIYKLWKQLKRRFSSKPQRSTSEQKRRGRGGGQKLRETLNLTDTTFQPVLVSLKDILTI